MSTPLLDRLRSATHDAHTALEDTLALLQPPLTRQRFVCALRGFLAFHRAWEPRAAAWIDPALVAPRSRVALIARDLQALGAPLSREPAEPVDLSFLSSASRAWGSLYVMEGSTLGGQVIAKALRGASWAPEGGLSYFNPYGRRTAAVWAEFRAALEAAAPSLDEDAAVQGARATFEALRTAVAKPMDAAA